MLQAKKKLCWHTTFGKVTVLESEYKREGERVRPFRDRAEVSNRGYSLPLQRVITDFGSDNAFGGVVGKLEEHYGISLPRSTIRNITEQHGEQMYSKSR